MISLAQIKQSNNQNIELDPKTFPATVQTLMTLHLR